MDDRTTTLPTPATHSEPSEVGEPRSPAALQALAAGIGVLAGIVVGAGAGLLVTTVSANSCSPSDGWCGLGALVAGLFAGVLSGVIAYVIAGAATIFRSRPAGLRSRHVLVHLALPFVAYLTLAAISGIIW